MTSGTKDQIKGAIHQVKGKAKRAVGEATDNPKLQVEGILENAAGKAQSKVGKVKRDIKKVLED